MQPSRMRCTVRTTVLVLALMLCGSRSAAARVVVCYYPSWSQYTPGKGKFTPADLDPKLCTHIHFAFIGMNSTYQVAWLDPQADPATIAGIRKQLAGSGAKVFLSVGGWDFGSARFSGLATSKARRARFIASAIRLLRQQGLQGLDIDWEYPSQRGGVTSDKAAFVALLSDFRAAAAAEAAKTRKPRLQLSVAVGISAYDRPISYDVAGISKAVDLINLMAYDYAGAGWSDATGHLAPLGGPAGSDYIHANVRQWLSAGAAASKTVLGIPTYAATWTLQNPGSHGVGAAVKGPGPAGPYTQTAGSLAYYEVTALPAAKKYYDAKAQAWYYVSGSTWASVDTPDAHVGSAARKGALIKSQGLAGAMFWELSQDAFQAKKYPLIRAVKAAMS